MSDITSISAGIGGGKSLFATIQVATELEKSERFIVTNLPLVMDELADYCHKWIDRPIDLRKRVRVLEREESPLFFLHLPGRDFKTVEEVASRQGQDYGCLYILDEAHIIYPARDWQKTGAQVEAYVSQLRKLNDDFLWVTQHVEKVDKNFRRNTTRWLIVKNLGKVRLLLGVGFPGSFKWDEFSLEPRRGDKPDQSGWYRMKDRGYMKLYNTMAGVGFTGALAAETKPKRGHWWRWAAAAGVCVFLAWITPKLIMGGVGHLVGSSLKTGNDAMQSAVGLPNKSSPVAAAAGAPVASLSARKTVGAAGVNPSGPLIVGFDTLSGRLRVLFSDGRSAVADRVSPGNWAVVGGEVFRWSDQIGEHETLPAVQRQ